MNAVITSLLETDLYKFTMWQALLHRHPRTQATYTFVCRNRSAYPLAELAHDVNRELDALCGLRFQRPELDYLRSLRYIQSDFVDYLRLFQFQRDFIDVRAEGETLSIVAKGPQVHVMGFEIFVLAIVNELYFRRFDAGAAYGHGVGIERPTRSRFEVQGIDQSAFQTLDAGPRDHHRVVGA